MVELQFTVTRLNGIGKINKLKGNNSRDVNTFSLFPEARNVMGASLGWWC